MVQTLIELRDEVRMILGNPSKKEIDDAQIDYSLNDTISVYTRYRPIKELLYFDIIAEQQEYTLPSSVSRVAQVITDVIGAGLGELVDVAPSPSLLVIDDILRKMNRQDGVWHFEPSSKKLFLYKQPSTSGTGAYIALKSHTVASIPDSDKHLIMRYAEGVCKVMMGTARAKRVTKIPTYYYRGGSAESGMMEIDDGAKLRKEGEEIKKEVIKQIQGASSFVVTG